MKTLGKRRFKNKESKYIREISDVIYKHIKMNAKDYLILSIVFIIGVMLGVMLINNSDENSKMEINGYIKSFVDTIKNENFEVDRVKLAKDIIYSNLKLFVLIWLAGTTIIGIPFIYLITAYKGISLGYTISAIMLTLGSGKGLIFSISALFLQNIIVVPIIFMLNVSSLKLYRTLIKKDRNSSIKQELIRHTILSLILIIPVILIAIISSYISSSLIVYLAKGLGN